MGCRFIEVKVKSPREIVNSQQVAADLELEVEVLIGRFSDHVRRARLVHGEILTPLEETISVGSRYVVDKTFEKGCPDEMISQPCVMTRETIARNEVELRA